MLFREVNGFINENNEQNILKKYAYALSFKDSKYKTMFKNNGPDAIFLLGSLESFIL